MNLTQLFASFRFQIMMYVAFSKSICVFFLASLAWVHNLIQTDLSSLFRFLQCIESTIDGLLVA